MNPRPFLSQPGKPSAQKGIGHLTAQTSPFLRRWESDPTKARNRPCWPNVARFWQYNRIDAMMLEGSTQRSRRFRYQPRSFGGQGKFFRHRKSLHMGKGAELLKQVGKCLTKSKLSRHHHLAS